MDVGIKFPASKGEEDDLIAQAVMQVLACVMSKLLRRIKTRSPVNAVTHPVA